MTTIKVKFRKSAVKGKPGTIYYQINHERQYKQITTKLHITPREWNSEEECINIGNRSRHQLTIYQQKIDNDLRTLHRIVRSLEECCRPYTTTEIITQFRRTDSRSSVLDYMQRQIDHLSTRRRYGTAENYRYALKSLSHFLNNEDISFSMLNEGLVTQYGEWLIDRQIKRNSLSFYMRIWRAVYNRAVKEHLVEQSFPFQNVYTGIDRTRKRAIGEEDLMRLCQLDLGASPDLEFTRDIFVFSYCTRGMAFVDIAFLKRSNITDTHITYYRHKTDQLLQIRIEPCIDRILRRYRGFSPFSDYVFPIIRTGDERLAYAQYQSALGLYNRKLKTLGHLAGFSLPISSYTARHTWATTARNHNVPLSVISAGMGHTSEKTTQIYLASLENSVIDEANCGLLSALNAAFG